MELAFENLHIPGDSGQRIIAYSAEPRTPSEAALRLLGSIAAGPAPDSRPGSGTEATDGAMTGSPATPGTPR